MPSSDVDLCYLPATDALVHFRSGELSPVELNKAVIERASLIESSVNPFADKYFDQAMATAREAEQRYRNGSAKPLDGIPLLVKDSSAIKGIRATVGSKLYADAIDQTTNPSVERLLLAGANFFARSTCPEWLWLPVLQPSRPVVTVPAQYVNQLHSAVLLATNLHMVATRSINTTHLIPTLTWVR